MKLRVTLRLKHFGDVNENAEFDEFIDKRWPLWREPKNVGGVMYQHLRSAFDAGWKAGSRRRRRT
jgi:hypothetical protein